MVDFNNLIWNLFSLENYRINLVKNLFWKLY